MRIALLSDILGGHTHIQMIRRYQDAHLVNVGSLGLPGVNAGSPELPVNRRVHWAEFRTFLVPPSQ
jgi:predicted phosphodiesterase